MRRAAHLSSTGSVFQRITRACAQIYRLPGLEEVAVATRFTLPVRAVAFSPDGTRLAAAGDDDGIKLVNVADTKAGACAAAARCTCGATRVRRMRRAHCGRLRRC